MEKQILVLQLKEQIIKQLKLDDKKPEDIVDTFPFQNFWKNERITGQKPDR